MSFENITFRKGPANGLANVPIVAGQVCVTTDTGEVYLDIDSSNRLPLGAFAEVATKAAQDSDGNVIKDTYVKKSGDTMTGSLTLSGAPTSNLHAATKKYVDDSIPGVVTQSTNGLMIAADKKLIDDSISNGRDDTSTYGTDSIALGTNDNIASATGSITIGTGNISSAQYAMAMGDGNTISVPASVAIGKDNTVLASYTDSSTNTTYTSTSAVSIGQNNEVYGDNAITIGGGASSNGNVVKGDKAIGVGTNIDSTGQRAINIGDTLTTNGATAINIGFNSNTSTTAISIGQQNYANNTSAVSIGQLNNIAYSENNTNVQPIAGVGAVAIGIGNRTEGDSSVALGDTNNTVADNSTAFGAGNTVTTNGLGGIAGGLGCVVGQYGSVAMGAYNTVNGANSAAFGRRQNTAGTATNGCTMVGRAGIIRATDGNDNSSSADAFIVGNGQGTNDNWTQSNAMRVTQNGYVYANNFDSNGADYAEYVKEWGDGNPNNEDRIGYMVTIKNGKLEKAQVGDYIIGITSGNPAVIGNADETYYWKYERDDFNRLIYDDVPGLIKHANDDGTETTELTNTTEKQLRLKSTYNPALEASYIPRSQRPEWDYVGMRGIVPVRDDGTCVEGGFCECGGNGIATYASAQGFNTYYVIERISENVVSVEVK